VRTGDLYGIVYHATTSSIEPGRRPIARGRDEESEEEVYRQNPQLLKLLRSEFSALVVGYREKEKLHHYLPPRPAKIHSFVYLCSPDEIRQFSQSFAFLNILISTSLSVPREELASACLRQMSQVYQDRQAFLVAAGKELAVLLSGELNQLKAILERIRQ